MIAIGFVGCAFIGAVARALVTDLDAPFTRQMWGTLAVNIVGSFLLGALRARDADVVLLVGVGGLGAFTTFSTFVAQVECIHREGKASHAVLYAVGTLIVGIGAGWIGWTIG